MAFKIPKWRFQFQQEFTNFVEKTKDFLENSSPLTLNINLGQNKISNSDNRCQTRNMASKKTKSNTLKYPSTTSNLNNKPKKYALINAQFQAYKNFIKNDFQNLISSLNKVGFKDKDCCKILTDMAEYLKPNGNFLKEEFSTLYEFLINNPQPENAIMLDIRDICSKDLGKTYCEKIELGLETSSQRRRIRTTPKSEFEIKSTKSRSQKSEEYFSAESDLSTEYNNNVRECSISVNRNGSNLDLPMSFSIVKFWLDRNALRIVSIILYEKDLTSVDSQPLSSQLPKSPHLTNNCSSSGEEMRLTSQIVASMPDTQRERYNTEEAISSVSCENKKTGQDKSSFEDFFQHSNEAKENLKGQEQKEQRQVERPTQNETFQFSQCSSEELSINPPVVQQTPSLESASKINCTSTLLRETILNIDGTEDPDTVTPNGDHIMATNNQEVEISRNSDFEDLETEMVSEKQKAAASNSPKSPKKFKKRRLRSRSSPENSEIETVDDGCIEVDTTRPLINRPVRKATKRSRANSTQVGQSSQIQVETSTSMKSNSRKNSGKEKLDRSRLARKKALKACQVQIVETDESAENDSDKDTTSRVSTSALSDDSATAISACKKLQNNHKKQQKLLTQMKEQRQDLLINPRNHGIYQRLSWNEPFAIAMIIKGYIENRLSANTMVNIKRQYEDFLPEDVTTLTIKDKLRNVIQGFMGDRSCQYVRVNEEYEVTFEEAYKPRRKLQPRQVKQAFEKLLEWENSDNENSSEN